MTISGESQTLRPDGLNVRFQQDRTFALTAVIGWL
jgi:hypothetical protein